LSDAVVAVGIVHARRQHGIERDPDQQHRHDQRQHAPVEMLDRERARKRPGKGHAQQGQVARQREQPRAVIAKGRHGRSAHRLELVGAQRNVRGQAQREEDRHHDQPAATGHGSTNPVIIATTVSTG
jgi:hypothetical protein